MDISSEITAVETDKNNRSVQSESTIMGCAKGTVDAMVNVFFFYIHEMMQKKAPLIPVQ